MLNTLPIISRIIIISWFYRIKASQLESPMPQLFNQKKGESTGIRLSFYGLGVPTFSGFAVHGIPSLEIPHQEVGFGTSSDGNQIGFYTQLIH